MEDHEPSHGFWCNAKTYPTRCKHCGKQVFFFSCDHGSKVFFDYLGWPWKQHACIEMGIAVYGKERIEREIADRMMTPYMRVDYERYVKNGEERRKKQPKWEEAHLTRLDPYLGARTEEMGLIRELSLDVNVLKRLKVEDTDMWRSALGRLAKEPHAQITVHTGALGDDDISSLTFLVPRKWVTAKALAIGDFIKVVLSGRKLPDRDPFWVCEKLNNAFE